MVADQEIIVRGKNFCVMGLVVLFLFMAGPAVWAEDQRSALPEVELSGEHQRVREAIREAEVDLENARDRGVDKEQLGQYYGQLGRVYHAHGFMTAAKAAYRNAARLLPNEPQWHYLLGMVAEAEGDQETAITQFSKVMNLSPNFVPAFVRRGRVFRAQGEWEEARRDFAEALSLDPDSVAAMAGMGRVMLAMDEYEEAVEYLESALTENPHATRLHHALGMAYRNMGDRDQARVHLDKHGDGDPVLLDPVMDGVMRLSRSPQFFFQQGLALASDGRLDRAQVMLARATSLDPDSARYAHRHGELLLEMEEFDGARSELDRALELGADEGEVRFLLGQLAQATGDDQAAMQAYQQVLDLDDSHLPSREHLSVLQMADGQAAAAENHFRWLARQVDDTEHQTVFLFRLAMSQVAQDQCRRAADTLETIERDLDLLYAPALVELSRLRATCLDVEDEALSEARDWMESIHSRSDALEVRETLAMVYAAMGDYQQAEDLQMGVLFEAARQGLHENLPDLQRNLRRYGNGQAADRPYPPDSWRIRHMSHRH